MKEHHDTDERLNDLIVISHYQPNRANGGVYVEINHIFIVDRL